MLPPPTDIAAGAARVSRAPCGQFAADPPVDSLWGTSDFDPLVTFASDVATDPIEATRVALAVPIGLSVIGVVIAIAGVVTGRRERVS